MALTDIDIDDLLNDDENDSAKFTLSTFKDHAKKKGMWAGALTPILIPDLLGAVIDDTELGISLIDITRANTPALLKIFDEILVNATDHAKGHEKSSANSRVTKIEVTYDRSTGRCSVYNDGPGIPVLVHTEATKAAGHTVYIPEVAFSYFLAGTNIDKDITNVKGGINGVGAKLTNVHSEEFIIETVDTKSKYFYSQKWCNRLDERKSPEIIELCKLPTELAHSHTRVSFIPAYAALGYKTIGTALAEPDDIDAWLRLRTHQSAAYVGAKVNVSYNGIKCLTTDATTLGKLLIVNDDAIILSTQAKATVDPYKQHPWNIAVVVLPSGKKAGRRSSAQNMTIINGVLSNKGSHIQYIKKLFSAAVEDKLRRVTKQNRTLKTTDDRKMSITETLAGVRLVICGAIPGADWGGQRKDELQVSKEALDHYNITATFLKQVGDAIAERILIGQGTKSEKVVHDKYTKARYAGKANYKRNTFLLAAEGDSAITLLRAGLTQSRRAIPSGGPSLDWCGIISLQGVIVNAAREVTEIETAGGDIVNIRSAKLQTNKRLVALADAFGLQYNRTYTTPEELATLNYGQLLLCVDQDLDGTGKIAALVLVWIYLFWPALISSGRIGRFMTPLVRAYPKKGAQIPVEFYYEEELIRWINENPSRTGEYRIKYYKGLATHDEDEVKRMFTVDAFKQSIYTYTMDDTAKRLFEVYFGIDPALRKKALISPVMHLSYDETHNLHKLRQIPVGRVQLDVDTKSYKNDAIKRQIAGGPDGQNSARRKILMGAMLRYSGESASKELKIFQLGGYVADKCFYHHGDASLNGTIVYLAQAYAGARKYPWLIGVGQFGSRHGDKAGSARYISVKLSPLVKVAFPPADRWHLQYVFEDGERAEPKYFIPVVPMAALESYKIVSEGWNHDSHGRDHDDVLSIVNAYILGDPGLTDAANRLAIEGPSISVMSDIEKLSTIWPLRASTRGFDGEVRSYRNEDYSFGLYVWNPEKRTVTITELPMGLSTAKYLETLVKPGRCKSNPRDEFIESVNDRSSSDKVELEIILHADAFDKISENFGDAFIDPIEDAFMLRSSLRPHLNYYSADGAVLEFGECYLAAILYWAPLRRDLYNTRLTRDSIILELRLLEENAILRYITIASELELAKVENVEAASDILQSHGFPVLDTALIHRPEYTPNENLYQLATSGLNANYDYILDLKERDLVKKAAELRQKRVTLLNSDLGKVKDQLAEKPIAGASVWRAEIAEFNKVVSQGIATGWKFK